VVVFDGRAKDVDQGVGELLFLLLCQMGGGHVYGHGNGQRVNGKQRQ
jgi:hypothetical protein